jgi:hypothetical protein
VGEKRAKQPAQPAEDLMATLALQLLDNGALERMEADSTKQIFAVEPAYANAGIVVSEIQRATRSTLALSLSRLARISIDENTAAAPEEIGRLRAEQGMPLAAILHAFRLDFRILWAALVNQARETEVSTKPEFIDGCIAVWNAVELITEEVVDSYRTRERELHDRRSDERETAFSDLISRGHTDAIARARSSRLLGFPDRGRFAVLSGSLPSDMGTSLGRLRTSLARMDLAAHFTGPSHDTQGVIHCTSISPERLRSILSVLADGRFGVAEISGGPGDLPRGMRLASAVADALPPDQAGVVFLADAWLETLMHSDIEISDAFVNHVLGPILELPHQESSRLLETLEAFIGCDGSISDVSSTTFMHRNTVRKRLDRVEALSGRSLAAPAQAAELVLALAWLRRSVHTEPEPDAED